MRHRSITILSLLLLVGLAAFVVCNHKPEPQYQNRPLSYWLNYDSFKETSAERDLRYEAIRKIGTNGIPIYVAWLHRKDPYPKRKLIQLLAQVNIHIRSEEECRDQATAAWQMAGLSDELVNPIIWKEFSEYSFVCGVMSDGEEQRCINSLLHGAQEQRENAAQRMPRYSNLPGSIDALIVALEDKSPRLRYFAARSLSETPAYSKPAIPALIKALRDENEFVRMTAAFALGKFGKDATSARSSILPLLKDPNEDVRACARLALKQIDSSEIIKEAKK